jgi:hypothetical protein
LDRLPTDTLAVLQVAARGVDAFLIPARAQRANLRVAIAITLFKQGFCQSPGGGGDFVEHGGGHRACNF